MIDLEDRHMATDWTKPAHPATFTSVELLPGMAEAGPGIVTKHLFAIKGKQTARKGVPAISLRDLLFYVREAAMKFPEFRAELEAMMAALPPRGGQHG